VAESFTGGRIAARISAHEVFKLGVIARPLSAQALRKESGASHALAVSAVLDEGPDRPDFGGAITIEIADANGTVTRTARLVGIRDWIRTGATELGLDCLRRHLLGLPVDERIDFERR